MRIMARDIKDLIRAQQKMQEKIKELGDYL